MSKYDPHLEDSLFQNPDPEYELVTQLNRCHIRSRLLQFPQRLVGVRFSQWTEGQGRTDEWTALVCVVLSLAEQQSRSLNAYMYVEFRLDAKSIQRVPDEGDDDVALFNHN